MKNKTIVTPKGIAQYPNLRSTETYNGQDTGKYSVQLKLTESETDKLTDYLAHEWDVIKGTGEYATKRYAKGSVPNLGTKETTEGTVFKFKTTASIKTKSGDVLKKTVPIYDAKCNVINGEIGAGSTIKVACQIAPYYVSASNYGLTLYLTGVQVIEYVAPGEVGSASALGFAVEDGYEVGNDEESTGMLNPVADDMIEDF